MQGLFEWPVATCEPFEKGFSAVEADKGGWWVVDAECVIVAFCKDKAVASLIVAALDAYGPPDELWIPTSTEP